MDKAQYPEDLIIEIIHKFAEFDVEREEWLGLRLVNSMFKKSVILLSCSYSLLTIVSPRAFQ